MLSIDAARCPAPLAPLNPTPTGRDLKPANCLVSDNCYLKVADLGLAKMLGPEGRGYNKAGTPGYMAPEVYHTQGKSSGGYGFPSDL